jgi:hypothetical protein
MDAGRGQARSDGTAVALHRTTWVPSVSPSCFSGSHLSRTAIPQIPTTIQGQHPSNKIRCKDAICKRKVLFLDTTCHFYCISFYGFCFLVYLLKRRTLKRSYFYNLEANSSK